MNLRPMQDTVEVIIDKGSKTYTTPNPFGEKPCYSDFDHYDHDYGGNIQSPDEAIEYANALEEWQQAESERKTYEIENQEEIIHTKIDQVCCGNTDWECKNYCTIPVEVVTDIEYRFEPGSTHQAIIINNKAVII